MALRIGNKVFRNLQEQVGWNTKQIEELLALSTKNIVYVDNISENLSEEELEIVSKPVSFIAYNNSLYIKNKEDLTKAYFEKAIELDGTTNIELSGSSIEVTLSNGSLSVLTKSETTYKKSQIDTLLSELNNKIIVTEEGKKYAIVACVIRNYSGQWQQIGGNHAPINVLSVDNNTDYIQIKYNFTAKNVVSFVVTPDEDFARRGYFTGASVGDQSANIEIYEDNNAGGYIAWTGSAFSCQGDISSATISASGVITITHKNTHSSLGRSVNCRGGIYNAFINGINETQDTILLTDFSGNVTTTPDTNFRIFWNNSSAPSKVDPTQASESGNLWCFGIFEIE